MHLSTCALTYGAVMIHRSFCWQVTYSPLAKEDRKPDRIYRRSGRIHVCVFSWGQWGRVLNYRLPVRKNTHDRRSASGLIGYTVFQPQGDGSLAGNGPPNTHKSTIFNELYFNRISIKHAGNAIKGGPSFGGNGPPKLDPRAVILIPTN